MNRGFWKQRRVLVTGSTGFQGSWLCLWLNRLGAHVAGYSLPPPTLPSLYELAGIESILTGFSGDVRDLPSLQDCVTKFQPEIIFHLAAQALVGKSYQNPLETFSTNLLGTIHILETARRESGIRSLVCVTSDKCYENREEAAGYREEDRLGGSDPYSGSKAGAELAIASYRRSFFQNAWTACIASGRAGNVLGGGDWAPGRLVPDIMRSLMKGEEIHLRQPEGRRPWQHVLDPLRGYLLLAEHLFQGEREFAGAWNLGPSPEHSRTASWISERLIQLWGGGSWSPSEDRALPREDLLLHLDAGKAKESLGWEPRLSLDTTLEWVVEWYQVYHSGGDIRRITLDQIQRFEEGLS